LIEFELSSDFVLVGKISMSGILSIKKIPKYFKNENEK